MLLAVAKYMMLQKAEKEKVKISMDGYFDECERVYYQDNSCYVRQRSIRYLKNMEKN